VLALRTVGRETTVLTKEVKSCHPRRILILEILEDHLRASVLSTSVLALPSRPRENHLLTLLAKTMPTDVVKLKTMYMTAFMSSITPPGSFMMLLSAAGLVPRSLE
jgi:hypothetical protein